MTGSLAQLARLFLKLGSISFGGPAAHIALMEDEVVRRRRWLDARQFLDLIGTTHLIPGPNAVEMAGHVGYRRGGLLGSLVAATCFTLPAVLLAAGLAWAYQRFGEIPRVEPVLDGIKPAVLAVILAAVVRLGRKALANGPTVLVGLGVALAVLAGSDEVMALLAGTLVGVLLLSGAGRRAGGILAGWIAAASGAAAPAASVSAGVGTAAPAAMGTAAPAALGTAAPAALGTAAPAAVPLWKLALFFVKVAAVMYGGGYVLVAYLEGDLVGDYGWLTRQELLDAVAIGQITPGPMLSTATFAGYLVAGPAGAVVATLGMLLPCFLFVAVANPWIPRIRSSPWASRFLDAVNAASVGLMMAVTAKLSAVTFRSTAGPWGIHWTACLIALVAAVLAMRWRVAPAWLVLGGAAAGAAIGFF